MLLMIKCDNRTKILPSLYMAASNSGKIKTPVKCKPPLISMVFYQIYI